MVKLLELSDLQLRSCVFDTPLCQQISLLLHFFFYFLFLFKYLRANVIESRVMFTPDFYNDQRLIFTVSFDWFSGLDQGDTSFVLMGSVMEEELKDVKIT
jgi:hypothetical protein